jgi:K(+)-stimulated pyrophosphate-energized sodium pump
LIIYLFWTGLAGALLALGFALIQSHKVLKYSEGNETMAKIAAAIRTGANAYLKRQYRTVVLFFAVVFVVLCALAFLPQFFGAQKGLVNQYAPFAFITGGFFTGLSGYIGMKVATSANARTANAAGESLNRGLRVSFASGTVMGFTVVGFGLLDITAWFLLLHYVFGATDIEIGQSMVKFGIGVASMAMFARVGGGIFTKAADVGADLVGKVEIGIPEDDPRNPAVIADNVGDNVGDVAGMGADLYEAYAHAIIATFALGVGIYSYGGMLLPILVSAVGVLASIIGTFFVRTKEKADQKTLLKSLHMGTFLSAGIAAIASLPLTFWVTSILESSIIDSQRIAGEAMRENVWGIFGSIIVGIISGLLIGFFTEYYTSDTNKPTKELAKSSETGTATIMIGGISLGMKATVGPVMTVAGAALTSFFIAGGYASNEMMDSAFQAGLYGIGIASVGLVATLGINLATDAFGPVADNAGGIAEMARLPKEVRQRTDALDSLGNTTAATGKGFSIGATGFSALALLVSYVTLAESELNRGIADVTLWTHLNLSVTNPPVLIGLFIGVITAFFFAALTISAVHTAAQSVVKEVRRQFKEIVGLMEGTAEPDYATCVDLCTQSALKKMVAPSLLAFVVPIGTGLLLGAAGVVGMLAGIVVSGFALAVFMMTSGGAWDNAKKYIEAGNHGGKGSDQHKAAVIGDTVGDPFKDTAGPSFNILITLSSAVSLVFVGVTTAFSLM